MVDLFLQILDMSIAASWVILAVMVVRFLLRKAPKKYAYALWIAPLFRLICPVSFQSVVSAFNFSPIHRAVSQTGGELQFIPRDMVIPQVNPEIPAVDTGINTVISPVDTVISTVPPVMDSAGTSPMPSVIPEASVNPLQILIFAGMVIWLVGMAAMVTVSIVNYFRLKRGLRFAVRMEGNIWQCEAVRSPFLVGLIKPKIYLPYGLDGQTQEYILAHERYHLKRFDHIAKLLGYTALTIHWFNPLCHLAFRLMNGDMEMSCDEHVLERNNIPTTQYSYSLLTIATNRRFPAATPLAFAETGVKERMINVLNWKKPKKWVSVVAVMVCVILLISCTTNPKVNDTTADELQVNDPAMLEFPGVKWFVTPEELKEALNITEDQILKEYIDPEKEDVGNDYDRYLLTVTDLVLYGREVTYANFQFRRDPGYDFEFEHVGLMFAEDTDMEKLKEDLTEIYGPGAGESYTYYTSIHNEKHESTRISRMDAQLAYYAKSGAHLKGLEGNPFQDVLDDPEYMTHVWVNQNGCSVLPEETMEYLTWVMDQPWNEDEVSLQDDQALMEMLDQWPWISISISNRCATTVYRDVKGVEDEWTPYYSLNYMEFDARMLGAYRYREVENQKKDPTTATDPTVDPTAYTLSTEDVNLLQFPGIKWGASVEEVKHALNITEEQISSEFSTESDQYFLTVMDIHFLGEKVPIAGFRFRGSESGTLRLWQVNIWLDKSVDMDVMQETLSKAYNNEGTGEYYLSYDIQEGALVEYKTADAQAVNSLIMNSSDASLREAATRILNDPDYKTYNWIGSVKGTDLISPECLEWLMARGEQASETPGAVLREWFEKKPMVHMGIANRTMSATRVEMNATGDEEVALATHNYVVLDAGSLVWIMELEEEFSQGTTP